MSANDEHCELIDGPPSVMTLDAAIATHPQLWAAMTDAYRAAGESSFNDGVAYGMARSLAIVGKFSTDDVIERLCEETA